MTDELGIRHVRVLTIESEQPSGRKGFVRTIKCEEWFDKPKAVPKKAKVRPQDAFDYKHLNEAIAVGGGNLGSVGLSKPTNDAGRYRYDNDTEVDQTTFQPLDPSEPESIDNTMFEKPVKTMREYLGIPPRGFR